MPRYVLDSIKLPLDLALSSLCLPLGVGSRPLSPATRLTDCRCTMTASCRGCRGCIKPKAAQQQQQHCCKPAVLVLYTLDAQYCLLQMPVVQPARILPHPHKPDEPPDMAHGWCRWWRSSRRTTCLPWGCRASSPARTGSCRLWTATPSFCRQADAAPRRACTARPLIDLACMHLVLPDGCT